MSQVSERSAATVQARELVDAIGLEVLLRRASEVQSALNVSRFGDVAGVAAEVQRLGFAIERVQQR